MTLCTAVRAALLIRSTGSADDKKRVNPASVTPVQELNHRKVLLSLLFAGMHPSVVAMVTSAVVIHMHKQTATITEIM